MRQIPESGIYAFFNIVNGKCYVGSAVNLGERCRGHITLLRKGKHKNKHFQAAWNKYGEEAFVWVVLEFVADKALLIEREAEWIASFGSVYNKATAGSAYGIKHSKERREKMSVKIKETWKDTEHKEKRTAAIKESVNTPEEKKRRSEYRKKRWLDPEYRAKIIAHSKGKKRSEEAKKKMSEAQQKRFAEHPDQLEKLRSQAKSASDARWKKKKDQQ